MSYIQELIKNLSKEVPFKWRVQGANREKTKVQITAYIDARQVMDILDQHCDWSSSFEEIGGGIFCTITIHGENGEKFSRTDAGSRIEADSTDQMYEQGFKASASDAFKRAAVCFGVGRFLYDQPKMWLPCNDRRQPVDERGQVIWDLSEHMANKRTPVKAPAVSTPPTTAPETKKMTDQILSDMLKFIQEGKKDAVREAMGKYTMTLAQKKVLEAALAK
jgi:hypothetical protein